MRFFLWKECHCLLFCALNAWKPVIHLDPRWLLGPRADVDFHSLCKLSNYTGFFLVNGNIVTALAICTSKKICNYFNWCQVLTAKLSPNKKCVYLKKCVCCFPCVWNVKWPCAKALFSFKSEGVQFIFEMLSWEFKTSNFILINCI